jgi:hypothetical protein
MLEKRLETHPKWNYGMVRLDGHRALGILLDILNDECPTIKITKIYNGWIGTIWSVDGATGSTLQLAAAKRVLEVWGNDD